MDYDVKNFFPQQCSTLLCDNLLTNLLIASSGLYGPCILLGVKGDVHI